jgi:DNA-binding response OmpR family regulator
MNLPKNIVIVEDEVITQRYLQNIFNQHDIHVTGCFSSAKETIVELQKLNCDMLLMDINIKGAMDGIQLARRLLETYTIPIIFITAHNDDETLEEILELAPYGFIGKPFSSKEVMITIQIAYKRYLTHENLTKKQEKKETDTDKVIINKQYHFSKKAGKLYAKDISVKLNQRQTILIKILIDNLNNTVGYDTLIHEIWGEDIIADSALRTLIYSLRKILPDFPIVSHSKMGYMLEIDNI